MLTQLSAFLLSATCDTRVSHNETKDISVVGEAYY